MTGRPPARLDAGPDAQPDTPAVSRLDAVLETRPDARLVPGAIAAWAAAMSALGARPGPVLILSLLAAAGGIACLVTLALRPRGPRWAPVVAAVLFCAAGGAGAAALRTAAAASGPVAALAEQHAVVTAEAVVTADPRLRPAGVHGSSLRAARTVVPARLELVQARGARTLTRTVVLVIADDPAWTELLPSQRVRLEGRLAPGERDGTAALVMARGPPERLGVPVAVQRGAGRLRAGLREAVTELPEGAGGLVPGLVVGDTAGLPPQLEADFRTAGLTHLVAVSGANCAIVIGFVLYVARGAGLPRRIAPGLAGLALAGFVVLARPQPSVLRAALMGALALAALAIGRRRHGLPALAAAVLVLVLVDPWLARSYGFALSVLATGGILLLAPRWTQRLARRMSAPAAAALAVPMAAQVACAPVIVLLSGQVSLVAIPANLLCAPAVPAATILGLLAALTAPVSAAGAALLGRLAGLPAAWIVVVAERAAQVPHAALGWPGGVRGAALLALALLAVVAFVPRVLRRRRLTALLTVGTLGLSVPVLVSPGWPPTGWVLVACDVGQGDALVLNAGPGTAVVVDAGPDPRTVDSCLRRLRVRRVPLLVLTHLHADHIEGVPGVLHGRSVETLAVGPLDEPPEEAGRLAGWAGPVGLQARRVTSGETGSVGGLRWSVLGPRRVIRGEGSDPNNASVVLLAERDGVRMLLCGDIEPAAARALLASLGPAEVFKVPHHGSAYQEPRLVELVRPRVAVISVGAGNDYGHPAAATLDALHASVPRVMRTDQDGDIAVAGPVDRLTVVARR